MGINLSLLALVIVLGYFGGKPAEADVIAKECVQNSSLSYCKHLAKRFSTPNNPFKEDSTFDSDFKKRFEYDDEEEGEVSFINDYSDTSAGNKSPKEDHNVITTKESANRYDFIESMPSVQLPTAQTNPFYKMFPNLQSKTDPRFCLQNQYNFQSTCKPSKKLRYDLRLFCQDYADICGVPNINLYPSRYIPPDDGRPVGYGQKQKDGHISFGNSFSLGLGVLPGFEIVNSQGVDIANLPYLENTKGIIVNTGQDVGILGQRIGKGPARTMSTLQRGFPIYNAQEATKDDKKEQMKALRALGIPPQVGKALSPTKSNRGKKRIGYEPGFGAVNRHTFLATGKTDDDSVIVPGMGEIELVKGIGLGIG
uniref:Uncharacterized protein n=1 Tax=Syphacia muris TaxID=451379 RepID=A0A0N5AKR9_9BILA